MKILRDEREYAFVDFREIKCSYCGQRMWEQGMNVVRISQVKCSNCGIIYRFEPTRWKVYSNTFR